MDNLFFDLIRVAIGNQVCLSHTPSADEWGELFAMAKKQSLVGICFAGIQKLIINHPSLIVNLSESLRLQWMGMAAKIQQRNEVVNRHCVELQYKFSEDGIDSCILKGQGVASYYDEHLRNLRQSGDIDIWVNISSVDETLKFAKKIGEVGGVDIHHAHLGAFDDTEVELHFTPAVMANMIANRYLQKYFERQKKFCMQFEAKLHEGVIKVPALEFNLVFLLVHMYHHLFTEGVGLRQLMDYYFVLRSANNECFKVSEFHDVADFCRVLGLDKFASALIWVLNHVFGEGLVNAPWTPDEKDGEGLLAEIMVSGNFGKLNPDSLIHKEKCTRPYYRMTRCFKLLRFGKMEWFWGFVSSLYWAYWKLVHKI